MSQPVVIKGNKHGIIVVLDAEAEFQDLKVQIELFPAGGFGNQCITDRKRGTPHGGRIGLEKSTGNYQSV